MAKILKTGNVVPMASLGKFAAGAGVLVMGALMVAGWAASAFTASSSLFAGLLGSWAAGFFGLGAIAAAGVWLGEIGRERAACSKVAEESGEGRSGKMTSPVMVSPQIAFTASRVK